MSRINELGAVVSPTLGIGEGKICPKDLAKTVLEQAETVFPIDYRQMVRRYVSSNSGQSVESASAAE